MKERNKIAGALYGVAVGDAFGAPLEFMNKANIIEKYGRVTEMVGGGWLNLKPGEVTDDTQMTLCVAEGIVKNPDNPIPEIGKLFVEWYKSNPKDIGETCKKSIENIVYNTDKKGADRFDWINAAHDTWISNRGQSAGNGALMRTIYLGLYYNDQKLAKLMAENISLMTHWDAKSKIACSLYTLMIFSLIRENNEEVAVNSLINILNGSEYTLSIKDNLNPSSYVFDSLNCALHCFTSTKNFEYAVIEAANLGGDADTIAAITGGLAGALYGYDSIPKRWIDTLSDDLKNKLDYLVEVAMENNDA